MDISILKAGDRIYYTGDSLCEWYWCIEQNKKGELRYHAYYKKTNKRDPDSWPIENLLDWDITNIMIIPCKLNAFALAKKHQEKSHGIT